MNRAPNGRGRAKARLLAPWSIGSNPLLLTAIGIASPIAVAALLTLDRGHLSAADNALVLVVVTVAIASFGRPGPAALAALVSAASFDFFLTKPYESFRMSSQADTTTEILFVVVGLLVGGLAARGRRYQTAASESRHGLDSVHALAEQIANGEEPDFVLIAVATELQKLLSLADCQFVWDLPTGKGARIESDGTVRLNPLIWPSSTVGLHTRRLSQFTKVARRSSPSEIASPSRVTGYLSTSS